MAILLHVASSGSRRCTRSGHQGGSLQAAQRTSAALLASCAQVAASASSAARPLPTATPTASRILHAACGTPSRMRHTTLVAKTGRVLLRAARHDVEDDPAATGGAP